jgi:hypothetical protein
MAVRETFYNLHEMMAYYQYVKVSLLSYPSIMPKKEDDQIGPKEKAKINQLSQEAKMAFIGDVLLFVKKYYQSQNGYTTIPLDCLESIFYCKFCSHLTPHNTYGKLAIYFKRLKHREKRAIPRRLFFPPHLCDIAKDMGDKAEEYYQNVGYISGEYS